jgi:hypothetical protein
MHRFIQQLKGWLRGINHHASKKYFNLIKTIPKNKPKFELSLS